VETAVRAGERLRRIVDALLDFAQSEAGTLVPHRQPVDLARLTAETASMFRSAAERAGLRFEVIVPSPPVIAGVDAGMWSTIVTNLIANAVKFTADGAITIELQQSRRYADGAADEISDVVLTVTDTGVGIAAAEQDRVFERFYRSAGTSLGGAGIGLALVADLVHAHDGRVALTSTPDVGTTLTVTIPVEHTGPLTPDGPIDQTDRQDGHRPDSTGAVDGGAVVAAGPGDDTVNNARRYADRSRVLVVEDDADLRSYLAGLLTADGWEVTPIADAETALTALAEGGAPSWDLVLTDVMLPGRSGLELVAQLRSNRTTGRLPVIVLTARGGTDAAAEGLAAGADDYITKPFSSQELLARVRANIELHHVREGAIDDAEDRTRQVRDGLASNRTIGTAVGVLMATYRLTAQQGFQLLVKASQDHNRKLRDVAADVAATGKLPFRPTDTDNLLIKITSSPTR
jgi:DNA-binding response OmpR family regulator/anti-sigma regulatory factor (Ser/Thr protein kinase)